jgi:hypothetical protein
VFKKLEGWLSMRWKEPPMEPIVKEADPIEPMEPVEKLPYYCVSDDLLNALDSGVVTKAFYTGNEWIAILVADRLEYLQHQRKLECQQN